jgi:uncharacterized membrane protein YvlD (DUF360 family)
MVQLIGSALAFAFGLLLLPAMVRGVRVGGMGGALKAGLIVGLLSAFLGKLLLVLLTIVLLPLAILGPIGAFIVQALVNAILLALTSRITDGIRFETTRAGVWAAIALTILQTVVRLLA